MIRYRSLFVSAFALPFLLLAGPVAAQMCLGVPMGPGQTALALNAGFPESANSFGIEGRHKPTDALVLGAGYTLTSIDDDAFGGEDVPSQHTVAVQGSYEVLTQQLGDGPGLGICPNVGFAYSSWDELTSYAIPLGIGLGTAFDIGGGTALLAPYANPSFVLGKAELGDQETDWENDFGVTAGANLIVTNLLFGASFTKIGEGDGVFGVQAGIIF